MSDASEPEAVEPWTPQVREQRLMAERNQAISAAMELARQAVGQRDELARERDDYRERLKATDEAYRLQCIELCAAREDLEEARAIIRRLVP